MHKLVAITKIFISRCWVIFFILLCAAAYEQSSVQSRDQLLLLSQQLINLQETTQDAKRQNHRLNAIVLSQTDPRWIDLILRQKLGMSAESEKKVFFKNP